MTHRQLPYVAEGSRSDKAHPGFRLAAVIGLATLATPLPAAAPGDLLSSQPLPAVVRDVSGVAFDPDGNVWLIDPSLGHFGMLGPADLRVRGAFDFRAFCPGARDIDIAPDGTIYLCDPPARELYVLPLGASAPTRIGNATQTGLTTITSVAAGDPGGSLWILDGVTSRVRQVRLDPLGVIGGFNLTLSSDQAATDIELQPDGTLWVLVTGDRGPRLLHVQTNGAAAPPVASISLAGAGITDPRGFAFDANMVIGVVDGASRTLRRLAGPPPVLTEALLSTPSPLPLVPAGRWMTLVFDRPVSVNGTIGPNDLRFQGALLDTLGTYTSRLSPENPTQVELHFSSSAIITALAGLARIDLAEGRDAGDITDAATGVPAAPSQLRRIQYEMIALPTVSVGVAGGEISVLDLEAARFRRHSLRIGANVLGLDVLVSLQNLPVATGLVGGIGVSPAELGLLGPGVDLTLEYHPNAVHTREGGDERRLRIHQLIAQPDGSHVAIPLPGPQVVNTRQHTITTPLVNLAPQHAPSGPSRNGATNDEPALYATLPLDTVDDRTVYLQRSAQARRGGGDEEGAALTPGSNGQYTRHRITFPGYVSSTSGIAVTLREANLFERQGFPEGSNSLFVLESAGDIPVAVRIDVEYRDTPQGMDARTAGNDIGDPGQMRVVRRTGIYQEFDFIPNASPSVVPPLIGANGVSPITQNGWGVYGALIDPAAASIPAELTVLSAE